MKSTAQLIVTAAAALNLSACDQAKDAAAEASAKAEAAMPALKDKATAAMDAAKNAGSGALEQAKAAGAEAMAKGGSMIDAAKEWGLEKMGVPEADGLLEGFGTLIAEAKVAVAGGMNGEKAAALKTKWDELYAKSSETIKNLAPEQQEKLRAILATVKAKWDELMAKSKDGAVQ